MFDMRRISTLFLVVTFLIGWPRTLLGQGVITFGGTVASMCWIAAINNGSLAGVLGNFSTLTVGKRGLNSPAPLAIRLRSNAPYTLMVQVGSLVGIADGSATPASTTAQAIKTGDIGFGITEVDVSLSSVVGGGSTPIRVDSITPGFDVRGGWPTVRNGHTPAFGKTLHDIYGRDVQMLSGPRISADGDNYSNNNFITVMVGISTLPQYLTGGDFSGVVTFTIAPSGA
jgi:hypothetical protein